MLSPLLPAANTDRFQQQFDLQLASTDKLKLRVYALRCQVFCEELGFGMTQSDGCESDGYDQHSLHCLVSHRPTQRDVGCVRVVLPGARGGELPFEKFGLRHVDRKLLDWRKLNPAHCCEVSRLAVRSDFRRPLRSEIAARNGIGDSPSVVFALYQAVIALTLDYHFSHIFMVGEPRLARHLALYGINMRQVSPTFDYFGARAVFVATRTDFLNAVNGWSPTRHRWYQEVCESLRVADEWTPMQELAS